MSKALTVLRKLLPVSILGLAALTARGATYTFQPDVKDMMDLDHYKYYTWGFSDFVIPEGYEITSAVLTLYNINNWDNKQNQLNIWLLDAVPDTTVTTGRGRNQKTTTIVNSDSDGVLREYNDPKGLSIVDDYFGNVWNQSAKTKIATYVDKHGGTGKKADWVDLVYNFGDLNLLEQLKTYIDNGNDFGIGIDPDCHYWNDGVKLVITTSRVSVPDAGATAGLLAGALGALGILRRRLKK